MRPGKRGTSAFLRANIWSAKIHTPAAVGECESTNNDAMDTRISWGQESCLSSNQAPSPTPRVCPRQASQWLWDARSCSALSLFMSRTSLSLCAKDLVLRTRCYEVRKPSTRSASRRQQQREESSYQVEPVFRTWVLHSRYYVRCWNHNPYVSIGASLIL